VKLILDFMYFRKPLQTMHHEPRFVKPNRGAFPRTGRCFDWQCVRTNPHITDSRAKLWHLWLYTRDGTGEPLGRLICFGWVKAATRRP
jgi:hypothetical protein